MKVLELELSLCPGVNASHLDRWFEIMIKPGIKELALEMHVCEEKTQYNLSLFASHFAIFILQQLLVVTEA